MTGGAMTEPGPSPSEATSPGRDDLTVVHRRYVPHSAAHYAGNLVDGAYSLACFGDVATELCIRGDGDEGLFASYSDVQFLAPVRGGDVVEVTGTVVHRGRRSRRVDLALRVVCRARPDLGASRSELVDPPLVATTARGTVVVPPTPGTAAG
jgi:3-aminobutyryl-CoA ammonia-lyase